MCSSDLGRQHADRGSILDLLADADHTAGDHRTGHERGGEAPRDRRAHLVGILAEGVRRADHDEARTQLELEVIGDQQTLFPDNQGLVEATRVLAKEGFVVLPYTNDDLVNAKRLIDAGAAAVMPLGAPIGSGLGIQNVTNLRIMREMITEVPLILDAGVGTASDATIAMELGFDGVLMNTAIAEAEDSVRMATAMNYAVQAGRHAFLAGRMPKKLYASASSPLAGVVR